MFSSVAKAYNRRFRIALCSDDFRSNFVKKSLLVEVVTLFIDVCDSSWSHDSNEQHYSLRVVRHKAFIVLLLHGVMTHTDEIWTFLDFSCWESESATPSLNICALTFFPVSILTFSWNGWCALE